MPDPLAGCLWPCVEGRGGPAMSDARHDPLRAEDLVGTWRLRSFETLDFDGSSIHPFGERPVGYVVYTTDGHMITTISASGRRAIEGDSVPATAAARAEAFDTFAAYSGSFRVEGDRVIHSVEMSLDPDWVGSEQRRQVILSKDGQQLTLSAELVSAAGSEVRRLRWSRVPDVPT